MSEVGPNSRERILATARALTQARGYRGLSYRDLAREVGIKAASVYHYFPRKEDLGAAVTRRYCEDAAANLEALSTESLDPSQALRRYPETFRKALADGNRLCLCSFIAAEYDDMPEPIRKEVQSFADINVSWLIRMLIGASLADPEEAKPRAQAIFAAVAGAQLIARSRADIALYDVLIENYSAAGLIPA